jgi:Ca-activated chloride channel family protein
MNQFSFEYPWVFLITVLFYLCGKLCPTRTTAIYFPHIRTLMAKDGKKSRWIEIVKWLGIVGLLSALASPVIMNEYKNIKKSGRDIMLIIDSSDSMRQRGFDPKNPYKNKFAIVKEVVENFIKGRKDDRIGIINFASVAFIASPLTFEKRYLQNIVRMQELGVAGKRTAINDALLHSYNIFSKSGAKSKIIILLTDGIDNSSKISFDEIYGIIKNGDVKLYTIGIGSYRDFDAPYLRALAKAGKGKFYTASNRETLKKIYSEIDKLEISQISDKKVIQYEYLYIYPLFIAILSLLLFVYLKTTKGLD